MRWTGRPKRAGTGGKPHGGQGCDEEGFDVFETDDMVKWGVEGGRRQSGALLWPCCRAVKLVKSRWRTLNVER